MRDDLKLAAYAVALGYTLHTSASREPGAAIAPEHFIRGVPHDGLQFERGAVHVWATARGWRVAVLVGDRFPAPLPRDFHKSLLSALDMGATLSA